MNKSNRLLLALLAAAVGIAAWQSCRLHLEREAREAQLAHAVSFAAFYLDSASQAIANLNADGKWNDPAERSAFLELLAATQQVLTDANANMQDYQRLRASETAARLNDVYFRFMDWKRPLADALRDTAPLTEHDRAQLTRLNRIVSQVQPLYSGYPADPSLVFAKIDGLYEAWKKDNP
ncbi:hypothetical protein I8J29_12585 [Paenibacillus sp. MWE-103]|uniref:Uncharacterized protein n=1 Tax=Paenibacillus artemisiicola TaxID=1172618 RepID=A0ABS3W9R3_9BACL|nr:hypothetical protein [Paenibacillus artemisiicola]MBO7745038.1 hypothetical protein [Paenibacillus artemisiicola]